MSKWNIHTVKMLSQKSGIPQDFLIKINEDNFVNTYIRDHSEMSDVSKEKYVRVARYGSGLQKLHKWMDTELAKSDNKIPMSIIGGISKKSIRQAVAKHIRKGKFCFIKSDLKRFFESTPKKEVFSLICGRLNCSKEVSEILCNSITMPIGPVGTKGDKYLARGYNPSTRIAIWSNMSFFSTLCNFVWKKYKKYKPRISFYIDDIGISLNTTELPVVESLISDIKNFTLDTHKKFKHLSINIEKTNYYIIEDEANFVDYLGTKIYMNKIEISEKTQKKRANIRNQYLYARTKSDKKNLKDKIQGIKRFTRLIKGVKKDT